MNVENQNKLHTIVAKKTIFIFLKMHYLVMSFVNSEKIDPLCELKNIFKQRLTFT